MPLMDFWTSLGFVISFVFVKICLSIEVKHFYDNLLINNVNVSRQTQGKHVYTLKAMTCK